MGKIQFRGTYKIIKYIYTFSLFFIIAHVVLYTKCIVEDIKIPS